MSDYFNLNDGVREVKSKLPHFSKLSFKFNKKLLFVLAVTLALPITVILSQQKQDVRKFASESNVRAKTVGYIVEYKSAPISKSLTRANTVQLNSERIRVEADQLAAQKDILRILSKKDFTQGEKTNDRAKITGNFKYAINGIALDINAQEAEKLKTSPYVKAVYPDLEVKSLLMDSVPLINADKAWLQKDQSGSQITGKGINVAVIDSGIDYTHPDLGSSPVQERTFDKVSDSPITDDDYYIFRDYGISLVGNRIAYPVKIRSSDGSSSDLKIYVKDLSTGNSQVIQLPAGIYNVSNIALKDNILAYVTEDSSVDKMNLYFYDLNTNINTKISGLKSFGRLSIGNGYIMFSATLSYSNNAGLYDYDLTRKSYNLINSGGYFTTAVGDYYSINFGNCTAGVYLYKTYIKYDVKDVFTILDLDNQNILYNSCANQNEFYLQNFKTGEKIKISWDSGGPITVINKGFIGNGVVFIAKPSNSYQYSPYKIKAFDLTKNRLFDINMFKRTFDLSGDDQKICFIGADRQVYCHTYDVNGLYPPQQIFNDKLIGGYNFIDSNNNPYDDFRHGTHVSGIIAGNGQVKGVAPDAKLIAYKVLDIFNTGKASNIISAIDNAIVTKTDEDANNDISVINLSVGAYCGSTYSVNCGPDDVVSRAVDVASGQGIAVVVAAGNAGPNLSTISTPGTARTAITVGSVNKSKQISSFSSRGPVVIGSEIIPKPDIVAPGENICSALARSYEYSSGTCFDSNHIISSGTSMAAPHVAGVAALIKQVHPDWTPEQIKTAIKDTAEDLGLNINTQGLGLVNALSALKLPSPIETPTPTDSPTPTPSETPTLTPTPTPTVTLTPTLTPTLTLTPTPTPSLTPTPTPIPTFTLSLSPSADTFVKSNAPGTNFGSLLTLETHASPTDISYLKFNLSSLAGRKIVKATLILKVSDASSQTQTLKRGKDLAWGEKTLTYNNRPGFDAKILNFNAVPLNGKISLNILNAVKLKIGQNLTLGIASSGNDKAGFYSKEAATGNRPQLIIEYQ